MATKTKALAVARRFGFILDESVSGRCGECFMLTFDHPTHHIAGDCRSIHVEVMNMGDGAPSGYAWAEAIERMEGEGPLLQECTDPECDYHCDGRD